MRLGSSSIVSTIVLSLISVAALQAADQPFHDAPASAKAQKNPYAGQQAAVMPGKQIYARNCLACHGKTGQGTGNVPSLVDGKLKGVAAGEIFWFITKGDKDNGMPSWASLPEAGAMAGRDVCGSRWHRAKPRRGPTSAPTPEVARHEGEGRAAACAVHRFPLREAGNDPQDYCEGSAEAVRHGFGAERSRTGGAPGERVAGGARWIQGGTLRVGAGQSALDADRSERRHLSGGDAAGADSRFPRHDRAMASRSRRQFSPKD